MSCCLAESEVPSSKISNPNFRPRRRSGFERRQNLLQISGCGECRGSARRVQNDLETKGKNKLKYSTLKYKL